jgi:voltage-gated sodium channel
MSDFAKYLAKIFLNERFILYLILINAVTIFVQGFDISNDLRLLFSTVDNVITLLFLIELVVKLKWLGVKNYFQSGWNIFDAILIILALPSLILWVWRIESIAIDYLLILRVSRVFKFIRFIRFVPNIQDLIRGVQRALKASLVVLIGFFIYLFVTSIISCFLFKGIVPEYFSDPLKSFYSLFKIFTVEGWYEIPELIGKKTTPLIGGLTKLYFGLLLLSGGIIGLSLVNSIFVDAMVSDNNDELERKVDSLEAKIDQLIKTQNK